MNAKGRAEFIHEFLNRVFSDDLHARASFFGQWRAQDPDGCDARGILDRPSGRESIRNIAQVIDQAGRPTAHQLRAVPCDPFALWVHEVVGGAPRNRCGDGLDGLRFILSRYQRPASRKRHETSGGKQASRDRWIIAA